MKRKKLKKWHISCAQVLNTAGF